MAHYYKQDGTPCYFVEKVKGGTRGTTIKDARKLNLVPSVTEIIKLIDKPGLNKWLINQHILAAMTLPDLTKETDDDFIKRVKIDASEQSKKAREKGTEIHDALEQYFKIGIVDDDYLEIFESVDLALAKEFGPLRLNWNSEQSFASSLGYGGKVDICNNLAVIDFKTTDKDLDQVKCWPEHQMQGAAYQKGLGLSGVIGNIFISTKNIGEVKLILHDETEKHWKMFCCLLEFWKISKDYNSGLRS